ALRSGAPRHVCSEALSRQVDRRSRHPARQIRSHEGRSKENHMPELVCELIVSLDGFARGVHSPAYFGYFGPDLEDWIKVNSAMPHRAILGRRTYEALNELPPEVHDEGWTTMTTNPGWLFTRTLERADWPGLEVVHEDLVDFVRAAKSAAGPELRTLGGLSLVKQLLGAGLVALLKLVG